eukprot:7813725-Pyramimonas_sp.AAC.1
MPPQATWRRYYGTFNPHRSPLKQGTGFSWSTTPQSRGRADGGRGEGPHACHGKGATVLLVVGHQLQCAVLERGWPQSGRSIIGPLGQARSRVRGDGKGEFKGPGDPPLHPRDQRGHEK